MRKLPEVVGREGGEGGVRDEVDIVEWSRARRTPVPGREPERVAMALISPKQPPGGLPEQLLESLAEGDVLVVRREPQPDSPRPEFTFWTPSMELLGRLPDSLRGFVEAVLQDGFTLEFSVFWSAPPHLAVPECRLCVQWSLLVWPAPGETAPLQEPHRLHFFGPAAEGR